MRSTEGFWGWFTSLLPEKGEVLQFLLFVCMLALALWRVERENRFLWFEEEGRLELRAEGVQIQTDTGLNFRAQVLGGDFPELYGKRVYVSVYGLEALPSEQFTFYAKVRAEGSRIYASGSYAHIEEIKVKEKTVRDLYLQRVQEKLSDPQVRALVLSYLFGEARETLPQDMQYYFLKTGLVHLLVISGFHVGMVFVLFRYVLPYPYGLLLGVAGVSLYVLFLVPHEPPVLRAWLMLLLWVLVKLSEGRPNSVGILFFSGGLLLFVKPEFSVSFSFWLSFFATLYILLGLRWLPSEGSPAYRLVLLPFALSFFAFLGVSPLLLSFTHTSLGSVLFSPIVGYLFLPFTAYGMLELITFFSLPVLPLELTGRLIVEVVKVLSFLDLRLAVDLSVKTAFILSAGGALLLYTLSTRRL